MDSTQQVQQQMQRWQQAVISQDVGQIMTFYHDNVRAFDAISQLQFSNRSQYQQHWQTCLSMCTLSKFDIDQLDIYADGDLAVCSFLNHCGGIDEQTGQEQASWMRGTQVYRQINGQWLIVHEHFSAPFDPTTGAAMFDLIPEAR
ncbi:ketosteroid isomerase [Methylophaga lonarensis MPL]|uniref:Ketosteroid isomerase n=1 Tax=Methylophaga lonarensis MPL TaxID=1286106 RepID=M7PTU4_9GAMM|nr:nuclear transport factor 2 family protein [Methylophaga lonarensis]EMR13874.1 ketosteroid isomerase [Methylophaga lonarensis MPL]